MTDPNAFDYWGFFTREAERVGAPLYACLSRGVGADAELRAFANGVRKGQPPANILFAAVHFLLLRGAQHPLRRFFANLNGGKVEDGEDPFPVFKAFVAQYRDELAPLGQTAAVTGRTADVSRARVGKARYRAHRLREDERRRPDTDRRTP